MRISNGQLKDKNFNTKDFLQAYENAIATYQQLVRKSYPNLANSALVDQFDSLTQLYSTGQTHATHFNNLANSRSVEDQQLSSQKNNLDERYKTYKNQFDKEIAPQLQAQASETQNSPRNSATIPSKVPSNPKQNNSAADIQSASSSNKSAEKSLSPQQKSKKLSPSTAINSPSPNKSTNQAQTKPVADSVEIYSPKQSNNEEPQNFFNDHDAYPNPQINESIEPKDKFNEVPSPQAKPTEKLNSTDETKINEKSTAKNSSDLEAPQVDDYNLAENPNNLLSDDTFLKNANNPENMEAFEVHPNKKKSSSAQSDPNLNFVAYEIEKHKWANQQATSIPTEELDAINENISEYTNYDNQAISNFAKSKVNEINNFLQQKENLLAKWHQQLGKFDNRNTILYQTLQSITKDNVTNFLSERSSSLATQINTIQEDTKTNFDNLQNSYHAIQNQLTNWKNLPTKQVTYINIYPVTHTKGKSIYQTNEGNFTFQRSYSREKDTQYTITVNTSNFEKNQVSPVKALSKKDQLIVKAMIQALENHSANDPLYIYTDDPQEAQLACLTAAIYNIPTNNIHIYTETDPDIPLNFVKPDLATSPLSNPIFSLLPESTKTLLTTTDKIKQTESNWNPVDHYKASKTNTFNTTSFFKDKEDKANQKAATQTMIESYSTKPKKT